MTVLDSPVRRIASNVVRKFGQSITLTQRVTGAFTPATNSVAVTETALTVNAILAEVRADEIQGQVQSGDMKVVVAAKDLTNKPETGWRMTISSEVYEVVAVKTDFSGEQAALYTLIARGV